MNCCWGFACKISPQLGIALYKIGWWPRAARGYNCISAQSSNRKRQRRAWLREIVGHLFVFSFNYMRIFDWRKSLRSVLMARLWMCERQAHGRRRRRRQRRRMMESNSFLISSFSPRCCCVMLLLRKRALRSLVFTETRRTICTFIS